MPEILNLVFQNPVVAFVILVGVVVFVHELGHYLVGVLFKLKIEEFSLGFGPKAIGFVKNGTEYKICWLHSAWLEFGNTNSVGSTFGKNSGCGSRKVFTHCKTLQAVFGFNRWPAR
jgi:hypothetical protein